MNDQKECENFDKINILYKDWIGIIALNTYYIDVYEHLIKHLNEEPELPRNLNAVTKWEYSLLNLFAIIEKQLEEESDIKEQCKILCKKALEYQNNCNDDEDYFENDYIKRYRELMNI